MAAKSNLGVACRPLASLQVNEIKRKKFPPPFFILDAVSIFRRLSGRSAATSKLFQQLMNFSFFLLGASKDSPTAAKKKKLAARWWHDSLANTQPPIFTLMTWSTRFVNSTSNSAERIITESVAKMLSFLNELTFEVWKDFFVLFWIERTVKEFKIKPKFIGEICLNLIFKKIVWIYFFLNGAWFKFI